MPSSQEQRVSTCIAATELLCGSATLLKAFLAKAEYLGILADRQGGLNLKHSAPTGNDLNLGTNDKRGYVRTGPATWFGRSDVGRSYNEELARAIGGIVIETKNGEDSGIRTALRKMPRLTNLLPQHEDEWLAAMDRYIKATFDAAREK